MRAPTMGYTSAGSRYPSRNDLQIVAEHIKSITDLATAINDGTISIVLDEQEFIRTVANLRFELEQLAKVEHYFQALHAELISIVRVGDALDIIYLVARNMESLEILAERVEQLLPLLDHIDTMGTVAESIEYVEAVANEIELLRAIGESLPAMYTVVEMLPRFESLTEQMQQQYDETVKVYEEVVKQVDGMVENVAKAEDAAELSKQFATNPVGDSFEYDGEEYLSSLHYADVASKACTSATELVETAEGIKAVVLEKSALVEAMATEVEAQHAEVNTLAAQVKTDTTTVGVLKGEVEGLANSASASVTQASSYASQAAASADIAVSAVTEATDVLASAKETATELQGALDDVNTTQTELNEALGQVIPQLDSVAEKTTLVEQLAEQVKSDSLIASTAVDDVTALRGEVVALHGEVQETGATVAEQVDTVVDAKDRAETAATEAQARLDELRELVGELLVDPDYVTTILAALENKADKEELSTLTDTLITAFRDGAKTIRGTTDA